VQKRARAPADVDAVAQVKRLHRLGARLEVTDVEVGECMVDEAMKSPIWTVHVLVDQAWDEVRSEGDHKRLRGTQERAFVNRCVSLIFCFLGCV